jgi:glycosyltransferase involved in cell wall biosynthesis
VTSRRITLVASEVLGRPGTGGAGTADSLLAVALARRGHRVDLLVASGREVGEPDAEWAGLYASNGVQIRMLESQPGATPRFLATSLEVFDALREQPPEVVIVDDWRGLGYVALRARQLGRALGETAFIVHCHGPARVLAEFAQKVPDTVARFGEEVMERASLELAEAVVSPSSWLLDWMREHGWPVPGSASVIQYLRDSEALDGGVEVQVRAAPKRLAFFGQLREGKGIRIFLSALEQLEPKLIDGLELVFLGKESRRWTRESISGSFTPDVTARLGQLRFETSLDRNAALGELLRPGTVAVMPSLLDNSPNTVAECIARGIPFVSTWTGGIPELVAEEDRARVLSPPTPDGLAAGLTRALGPDYGPARPAREPGESLAAWCKLVETVRPAPRARHERATRVALVPIGESSAARARRLAQRDGSVEVEVVAAPSRSAGVARATGEWVVFLDDEDIPDDAMLDTLVEAQAATGADVVTASVRPAGDPGGHHLFLGDPGALGLVENQYGVVGLLRRSLAATHTARDGVDPDWLLFARAALSGARIVSVPEPLATHTGRPGRAGDVPGEGLAVLEAFEQVSTPALGNLPQLAATLAASSLRSREQAAAPPLASVLRAALRRAVRR